MIHKVCFPLILLGLATSGCALFKHNDATSTTVESYPPNLAGPNGVVAAGLREPQPGNEAAQKLASVEDERNKLALRVQMLQNQVEEKEKALTQATKELESTQAEMTRTRGDLEQWKRDTRALRDKFRESEKENANALQSIMSMLEKMVEHEGTMPEKSKPPQAMPQITTTRESPGVGPTLTLPPG